VYKCCWGLCWKVTKVLYWLNKPFLSNSNLSRYLLNDPRKKNEYQSNLSSVNVRGVNVGRWTVLSPSAHFTGTRYIKQTVCAMQKGNRKTIAFHLCSHALFSLSNLLKISAYTDIHFPSWRVQTIVWKFSIRILRKPIFLTNSFKEGCEYGKP
jgi:hypothetical protein